MLRAGRLAHQKEEVFSEFKNLCFGVVQSQKNGYPSGNSQSVHMTIRPWEEVSWEWKLAGLTAWPARSTNAEELLMWKEQERSKAMTSH